MYRNTKNVPYYVFGKGSFAQLGDLAGGTPCRKGPRRLLRRPLLPRARPHRPSAHAAGRPAALRRHHRRTQDHRHRRLHRRDTRRRRPPALLRGGHRRRCRAGHRQGRGQHAHQPRQGRRLSGLGPREVPRRLQDRRTHPFGYRGRMLAHLRAHQRAARHQAGHEQRLHHVRPVAARP